MRLPAQDSVAAPDLGLANPLTRLEKLWDWAAPAGTRLLLPLERLVLQASGDPDPRHQDHKEDFAKQNVVDFALGDTRVEWRPPHLVVSYRGGPDSHLAEATGHRLGEEIGAYVAVGSLRVRHAAHFNRRTQRYELTLQVPEPDFLEEVPVQVAWSDAAGQAWDSRQGANYRYVFAMPVRGWEACRSRGTGQLPHGGLGSTEYRTLWSNYFGLPRELGRTPLPWSYDCFGSKAHGGRREEFFAVHYADLHRLEAGSGIGLHRHRDNQEMFVVLAGQPLMMLGDWCERDDRQRALELRRLGPGDAVLLRPGQLHGLLAGPEGTSLFTLGGYD